ncbi:MAG: hypothetical protein AB7O74_00645 [Candidatus Nanopelagicales bacterium]
MRRVTTVTALSVAGVLLAAGTAAALNAQVLGGPTRSSVGTADTLLPDDPFSSPTVGETGAAAPTDEASESVESSESPEPSTKPSTSSSSRPSRPTSPSTVPATGGGSTAEPGDDKGGDSGNSGSGSSGGSDDHSGKGSGGSDDGKPDDD